MTYTAEQVKAILTTFVKERCMKGEIIRLKDSTPSYINSDILSVETYWSHLKLMCKFDAQIDTSIKGLDYSSVAFHNLGKQPFRPVDYQFNFLYYLTRTYTTEFTLHEYIDGFLYTFKDQLGILDILKTNSGATRCKTNLRFTLNALRDINLVVFSENNKRSWKPSLTGLLALLNIKFFADRFKTHSFYKTELQIFNQTLTKGYFAYDPLLLNSILDIQNSYHLYDLLSRGEDKRLKNEEIEILRNLVSKYVDFIGESLIVSDDCVKEGKRFKQKAKEFIASQQSVNDNYDIFKTLYSGLSEKSV